MAHTLSLYTETTQTVNLSSGDYRIKSFAPQPPKQGRPTVTESAMIYVKASNLTNLQADIRAIEKLFEIARFRRLNRSSDRVFVVFQQDGDATSYRSEIYAEDENDIPGRVLVDDRWLQTVHWTDKVIQLQITWERRPYWEDTTLTELSLSNNYGGGTGGLGVYNPHATTATYTASTISFANSGYKIYDSANGFTSFDVGDTILIRGSGAGNNQCFTIATKTDNGEMSFDQECYDESAGSSISMYYAGNYVHIEGANIGGSLPAPLKISFENESAGNELQKLWIFSGGITSDIEHFPHILEGEWADRGSVSVNSAWSAGQNNTLTVQPSTESVIGGWELNSEMIQAANSAHFLVVLRLSSYGNIGNIRLRAKLEVNGVMVSETGLVEWDDTYAPFISMFREVGVLQIPPINEIGSLRPESMGLWLYGYGTNGVTYLYLDSILLMPLDGYRKLYSISPLEQYYFIIDDPIDGVAYQYENDNELVPSIIEIGEPIFGVPGKDNRLYFLMHSDTDGDAAISRLGTVRVYYRKRIATL